MERDPLYRWKLVGLIALALIVLSVPFHAIKESRYRAARLQGSVEIAADFVGSQACIDCHEEAYDAWVGSDHDRAMSLASDSTVLGDFDDVEFESDDDEVYARFYTRDGKYFVRTEGPDGQLADFEIAYTFGFEPLQQYLVPFPGGRLQALTIAWDTESNEWFYLYPDRDIELDDWLHWTRGGQNWNGMCAECHSTNVVKGYDAETQTFSTTWSELGVGCEACHGPGYGHVEWAEVTPMARLTIENYGLLIKTSDIGAAQQVELCAPCHSHHVDLGRHEHTQAELLQEAVPSLLIDGLYFADGQIIGEVYDYASFQQSKMYRTGIHCGDCHDAHDLELIEEGNELCLRCHRASTYDTYDHHFHEKIVDGEPSDGALCVKCHMPETAFAVVDYRADHSIQNPRPDLTLEIGVPNACAAAGCHDDETDQWNADYYVQWYGEAKKDHYGTTFAAARDGRPVTGVELASIAGDTLYPAIVRATALSLLRSYPGDTATAAFESALRDRDALVRYAAADNLNAVDTDRLAVLLAPLLLDPVKAVRLRAAMRLAGTPAGTLQDYQREALDEALLEFRDAMAYSLDFPFAELNLGNLHLAQRDSAGAEPHYRAAIAIDDRYDPAKLNLAALLIAKGEYEEAEGLLLDVLADRPQMHEAAHMLAHVLTERERHAEAADYLRQVTEALPDQSRIYLELGLAEGAAGRNEAAESALLRALQLEPDNLDYLFALADHFVRRGEFDRALVYADRMIATHPELEVGSQVKIFIEEILMKSDYGIAGYGTYDLRGISDYRIGGR
jgi:tetratricopeptide (TPR) repeat protein